MSASHRRASTPSAATASRAGGTRAPRGWPADAGAPDRGLADARAVADAGAFAVVLEMVPGEVAKTVTKELSIPTVGIGAGPDTDAQVLVWQDMAGPRPRQGPPLGQPHPR